MEFAKYKGRLKQRRKLICRGTVKVKWQEPVIVWIDDDDVCKTLPMSHTDNHGAPENPLWHFYQMKYGLMALRCPLSISDDERWRIVVDDPIGSSVFKIKAFLVENGRHAAASYKSNDEGNGDWI
jgi:hypothetical protein